MPKGQGQADYDLALAECEEAKRKWEALQASITQDVLDPDLIGALLTAAPRGLYRHFKGGLYVVESVVYDVNGLFDPCVNYAALYGKLAGYPAGRVLYGKNGFLTPVTRAEYLGRRFIRLRNLSVVEAAKLRSHAKLIAKAPTPESAMNRIAGALRP